jgi:hypothetical protein
MSFQKTENIRNAHNLFGSMIGRGPKSKEQEAVTTRRHKIQSQFGRTAIQIFAANDRMNQLLIEHLDPAAWTAKLPAKRSANPSGNTRTIAAIFTHMHNVRAKWVRLTAPHLKIPAPA